MHVRGFRQPTFAFPSALVSRPTLSKSNEHRTSLAPHYCNTRYEHCSSDVPSDIYVQGGTGLSILCGHYTSGDLFRNHWHSALSRKDESEKQCCCQFLRMTRSPSDLHACHACLLRVDSRNTRADGKEMRSSWDKSPSGGTYRIRKAPPWFHISPTATKRHRDIHSSNAAKASFNCIRDAVNVTDAVQGTDFVPKLDRPS